MNAPTERAPSTPAVTSRGILLAGLVIAVTALLAYHGTFACPFVFDDNFSIRDNPTIRYLWPPGDVLVPPLGGLTVSGRPLVNLSLAVNFALSGPRIWSYHALNLAVHVLAGLTLFGLVRRTLLRPVLVARFGADALPLALAAALLWTLHPLQTESVTYIVQRTESMMGLFYLLTLYCFVRSVDAAAPVRWRSLAVVACLLGMASKEVMVSAPVIVLLYDRTFVAGSFRESWRQRGGFYLGLAGTWVLLGLLVASTGGNRGGTAGLDVGVAWWAYGLTQFKAVVYYLQHALWPYPQIFEYGTFWVRSAGEVVPYALVVLPLVAGTVVALWRWPVFGFLGCWFFAILAPTSLVPGTIQMIAEHRMYLALAVVMALVVAGFYLWLGRRSFIILAALAVGLGALTELRNRDYRTELGLWNDTIAKRPDNAGAHYDVGVLLSLEPGRMEDAIWHLETAVRIRPGYYEAHDELGLILAKQGRVPEAVKHFESALRINPKDDVAHCNLGLALYGQDQVEEAVAQYEAALQLKPDVAETHVDLGIALARLGRSQEAVRQYQTALTLDPDSAAAHYNLARILVQTGRIPEAVAELEAVVRLAPDDAEAQKNLAGMLLQQGRGAESIPHFQAVLRGKPDEAGAESGLGIALYQQGRVDEAIALLEHALQRTPDDANLHFNLGNILLQQGRGSEAATQFEATLQIRPEDERARAFLDRARSQLPPPSSSQP